MKKISKELNQLNQQQQNKITDEMFSMNYCPSLSRICAGARNINGQNCSSQTFPFMAPYFVDKFFFLKTTVHL